MFDAGLLKSEITSAAEARNDTSIGSTNVYDPHPDRHFPSVLFLGMFNTHTMITPSTILWESEDLLALNKPSGIPSAPAARSTAEVTAVDEAVRLSPALAEAQHGFHPQEHGLLHRLDTETSGVLLFAKTPEAFETLRSAWADGAAVFKIYRAIVVPNDRATPFEPPYPIYTPIGRSAKSSKKVIALSHPGKNAQIRGQPLDAHTVILAVHGQSTTLLDLEIQIFTGVMHQIRCHLSSLGYPLLGDPLYKGPESTRLWLHASRLKLPAPWNQEITAPLPINWPSL